MAFSSSIARILAVGPGEWNRNLLNARVEEHADFYAWRSLNDGSVGDADLSGRYLAGAVFREAHVSRSSFVGCNLAGADFTGCLVEDVDFSDALLFGVNFARCALVRCRFGGAHFFACKFDGCQISQCRFWRAILCDESLRSLPYHAGYPLFARFARRVARPLVALRRRAQERAWRRDGDPID